MSITRASFDATLWPHDLQVSVVANAIALDPFLGSLTQRRTRSGSVAFPLVNPDGADWTGELAEIPEITPNDDALVVAPAKIAGTLLLSNESVNDTEYPLTATVTGAIAKAHVAKAQRDTIYGPPAPNSAAPAGFYDSLTASSGETLRAAVVDAAGDILGNGGQPSLCFISAELWKSEAGREGVQGPVASAPQGLFADLGLRTIVVPGLAAIDGIVLDQGQAFTALRNDVRVDVSTEAGEAWKRDGVSVRVIARVAVALPEAAKYVRSLTVSGD